MVQVGFPKQVPGISEVAIGHSSRNASGDQAITGLGFVPKVVIFLAIATGGTHQIQSSGYDDGVNPRCIALRGDQVDAIYSDTDSIIAWITTVNNMAGHIKSMDSDGFTITWTLGGTVTVTFMYLAMR